MTKDGEGVPPALAQPRPSGASGYQENPGTISIQMVIVLEGPTVSTIKQTQAFQDGKLKRGPTVEGVCEYVLVPKVERDKYGFTNLGHGSPLRQ